MIISFFQMLLYCAVIIFVAFLVVWAVGWLGKSIDGNLYKAGQAIVFLLCLIAFLSWLLPLLGFGGSLPRYFPRYGAVGAYADAGTIPSAGVPWMLTKG